MSCEPVEYNLNICQGADFNLRVQICDENNAPVDITGNLFRGQIKRNISADNTVIATFDIDIVDAVNGIIEIKLDETTTTLIELKPQKETIREPEVFAYDIKRIAFVDIGGGTLRQDTFRFMQGEVYITPQVTTI